MTLRNGSECHPSVSQRVTSHPTCWQTSLDCPWPMDRQSPLCLGDLDGPWKSSSEGTGMVQVSFHWPGLVCPEGIWDKSLFRCNGCPALHPGKATPLQLQFQPPLC